MSKPTQPHGNAHWHTQGGTTRVLNHRVGCNVCHSCENKSHGCSQMLGNDGSRKRKANQWTQTPFWKAVRTVLSVGWEGGGRDSINRVATRRVWVPSVSFVAKVRGSIIHRAVCHIAVCLTPELPEDESVWKARVRGKMKRREKWGGRKIRIPPTSCYSRCTLTHIKDLFDSVCQKRISEAIFLPASWRHNMLSLDFVCICADVMTKARLRLKEWLVRISDSFHFHLRRELFSNYYDCNTANWVINAQQGHTD